MSYILGGKKLRQGRPFTHNGIQYPANWLKLSTSEDKALLVLLGKFKKIPLIIQNGSHQEVFGELI